MHFPTFVLSLVSLASLAATLRIPGTSIRIEISNDNAPAISSPQSLFSNSVECRFNPRLYCDEGGHTFVDGDECPEYCRCGKDGKPSCEGEWGDICDAKGITRFCNSYAVCSCGPDEDDYQRIWESQEPISLYGKATCPKHDAIELECGKKLKSTKDCPKVCSCDGGEVECSETDECDKAAVEFMCKDYAKCHC